MSMKQMEMSVGIRTSAMYVYLLKVVLLSKAKYAKHLLW